MKIRMNAEEFSGETAALFLDAMKEMGIGLTGIERHLRCWADYLYRWKGRRVVGFENPKQIAVKLLADSFSFVNFLDVEEDASVLDLGSGNGWPGLAFKMAFPGTRLDLLDSRQGACDFIKGFVNTCGLDNVNVLHLRAEEFEARKDYGSSYSFVVSRAMAGFGNVMELCAPFVKDGGNVVLWLGPGQVKKIEDACKHSHSLGLSPRGHYPYTLPMDMGDRCLAIFSKTHSPATGFPRKYSAIMKHPLFLT